MGAIWMGGMRGNCGNTLDMQMWILSRIVEDSHEGEIEVKTVD